MILLMHDQLSSTGSWYLSSMIRRILRLTFCSYVEQLGMLFNTLMKWIRVYFFISMLFPSREFIRFLERFPRDKKIPLNLLALPSVSIGWQEGTIYTDSHSVIRYFSRLLRQAEYTWELFLPPIPQGTKNISNLNGSSTTMIKINDKK